MIKLITVVGARPQFIKAAAISRAIRTHFADRINEIILHTGQHYDDNMSAIFFEQLGIPQPKYNLSVGSSNHGKQTAEMMLKIEEILLEEQPTAVLIYGDTNSTLAAALAAAKIHIPVVHIEAGLRSFNKKMPEEINRICSDHVSTLLFSPTQKGIENLQHEGFNVNNRPPFHVDHPGTYRCGDIMLDNALYFSKKADEQPDTILKRLNLTDSNYVLVTLHRDTNTDNPDRLKAIFRGINTISKTHNLRIIFPLHPRTQRKIDELPDSEIKDILANNPLIAIIPPAPYLDFIQLEKNAQLIITDSGGIQKEAYFFKNKCLVLRNETEWVELIELGVAQLCPAHKRLIVQCFESLYNKHDLQYPQLYGDGTAAEFILARILENFA